MHFDVWVILEPPAGSVRRRVEAALDPFDMAQHTRDVQMPCICVGERAREHGRAQAARDIPEVVHAAGPGHDDPYLDALRAATSDDERARLSDEQHARYMRDVRPLVERLRVAEAEYASRHPLHEKPDPECRWCGGAGEVTEHMNPDGHFDYYRVEGEFAVAAADAAHVGVPYAMVADGMWQEMPLDVVTSHGARADAQRQWRQVVADTLAAHPRAQVVVVDCHG